MHYSTHEGWYPWCFFLRWQICPLNVSSCTLSLCLCLVCSFPPVFHVRSESLDLHDVYYYKCSCVFIINAFCYYRNSYLSSSLPGSELWAVVIRHHPNHFTPSFCLQPALMRMFIAALWSDDYRPRTFWSQSIVWFMAHSCSQLYCRISAMCCKSGLGCSGAL